MEKTINEYKNVVKECRSLFEDKLKDYGASWRILRASSVTDQIYIKINRLRTLQETNERRVDEDDKSEFTAIFNYSMIALIQLNQGFANQIDINHQEAMDLYDEFTKEAFELMQAKNHDYGEVWRDMRISSITDLIMQKLYRIKKIEDNAGQTIISEGLSANFIDMANYAVFSLILLEENSNS
ncbi:Domain of Uncharacterised Function (DUF1599) [Candidatus Ornithobacterium hominis]|uniref:DUF1599 domain-containing protein n=1 Tax=Candidatus Ornithobacterium hominis TaxID=2497989 RepID=UPI000E5B1193|nr:DUF1599 domain-containing protein [Candidatus Ornithobacterium hominis]SZD73789.1 Domain of Uncharacterised Function (DUF1599) [Candidatus Ornithobacterium hominis]